MYDLGLVLMGRSLDLLVAGPASLAGLGECGRKTGWAAADVAVARGASEKEPPVSGVPGAPGAVSIPKEARRLALVLLVLAESIQSFTLVLAWRLVSGGWL